MRQYWQRYREMTGKIGGEGSIEKKRASFTAGSMQVVTTPILL